MPLYWFCYEAAHVMKHVQKYHNVPKFLDRKVWETVQTQMRLLLIRVYTVRHYRLDTLLHGKTSLFKFLDNYSNFYGVRSFRIFTVVLQHRDLYQGVCLIQLITWVVVVVTVQFSLDKEEIYVSTSGYPYRILLISNGKQVSSYKLLTFTS